MKVAILGSRNLFVEKIGEYLPKNTTEIVSGGAKGVDTLAKLYAVEKNMKYTEFLPKYDLYGKAAPLKRNDEILDYSDLVIVYWDGSSRGTKYSIDKCIKNGKSIIVIVREKQ